ncbi:MAG: hypothetical protein ASARMPRED_008361 [Alectoria sarmentosa]|nr:MAG: hypothetical protein ASARMPRED_008361 [Alectoria sarmentosa]
MSELDWTDIKVVRAWLGKRYHVANRETGSPFFQYLKDELAKGNKTQGRETHLSRDEFLRWVWDTNTGSDGPRGFHYSMDAMRIPYYPEFIDELSQSRSPSPAHGGTMTGRGVSNASDAHLPDHHHQSSNSSRNKATNKPRKKKLGRKSKGAKKTASTSLDDGTCAKQSRIRAPLSASNSTAMGISKGVKRIDPEALRRQEARVGTLRPRINCKRGKTDFFHPDQTSHRQQLS